CKRELVADADRVGLGNNTSIADIDIITTSEIFTGSDAKRDVKIAYDIGSECMGTLHSIKTACRVSKKCEIAVGRIVVTRRIVKQSSYSIRCIVESGSVAKERCNTDCYILKTGSVLEKRGAPNRCVFGRGCVARKCTKTEGGVSNPCSQVLERKIPFGRIEI